MFVFSSLQLISLSILLISSVYGNSEKDLNRNRRQTQNSVDQNFRGQPVNSMDSAQSKGPNTRSGGFYSSNLYKPPNLSGEKIVGWFDTKYPNWLQTRSGSSNPNEKVEGKNGSPESLLSGVNLPSREDGGVSFLQKVAKQFVNKGEKSFNFAPYGGNQYRGSVCTNFDNINGYTFGKFPCPLPPQTGMNQLDRFCCGAANSQFCCNEREYQYYQQLGSGSRHRDPKSNMYKPSSNLVVLIVVPIIGTLVGILAVVIVFLYYKKSGNSGSSSKLLRTTNASEEYQSLPQEIRSDRPVPPARPNFSSQSNA